MSDVLLYSSDRSRVLRISTTGSATSVIRKESLGPGAARRTSHEVAILGRLAGLPGIPQLASGRDESDQLAAGLLVAESLVFEDAGGIPLTTKLTGRPLEVRELIDLALTLTEIIAAMHRRGVIHKDINPANIVLAGSPPKPMLIDFDLATTFAAERPGFTHHNSIVGTPAYLAPEQTGRTGWAIDYRADLYGLGATLYELATGSVPFDDDDLLQLVHDHLTRTPVPAATVNPDLPPALSEIIAHLLEKEPDRRYQSAEGVLLDLRRLRDEFDRGQLPSFSPGQRDFPWRLSPPSRLAGREAELAELACGFREAISGCCRGLLVSGSAGVGKTALVDELRPLVTAARGWFITGKFDQYRQDSGSDAIQQTTRALARMLLAEPESELASLRPQVLAALGANAALVATAVPELRLALGITETATGDPANVSARLRQAGLDLLGVIANPQRPVVIVLDDLQWAGAVSIGFIEAILTAEHLNSVLLVGAYRESEIDSAHPLTTTLSNWQTLDPAPRQLHLANLGVPDLTTMVAGMLRIPQASAAPLAEVITTGTGGNPFDTVELINALRRDGVLVPGEDGWTWSLDDVRERTGSGDVTELLLDRIAGLGRQSQELLEIAACLGDQMELDLLQAAAGQLSADPSTSVEVSPTAEYDQPLTSILEDGLLVAENSRSTSSVRFRHDRIQQTAYGAMDPQQRQNRHREIAIRLAAIPEYRLVAAEQYLRSGYDLDDPAERREVALLYRCAASRTRGLGNHVLADRYLVAAMDLVEGLVPDSTGQAAAGRNPDDERFLGELTIERHATLNALGRFAEVDQTFERIRQGNTDSVRRAGAVAVQMSSLISRGQFPEALDLGIGALADLEHPVPGPEDLPAAIEQGMDALARWAASGDAEADLRRTPSDDARISAIAKLLSRMIQAAFFCLHPVMPWLVTEAARLWDSGGPSAALVGPLAHTAFVTIPIRQDYTTSYAVLRRVLNVSEALGFEPDASQARFLFALGAAPWFEPLEECARQARRGREGLVAGADMQNACFTYFATTPQVLDSGPTLDDLLDDIASGRALATRTGNDFIAQFLAAYTHLVRVLRGETRELGAPNDPETDEEVLAATANPTAAVNHHLTQALNAVIFEKRDELSRRIAAAWPLLPLVATTQCMTSAYLLRALDTAWSLGSKDQSASCDRADPDDQGQPPGFDACREWLQRRSAEAPRNFHHLLCLVDAELAQSTGDLAMAYRKYEEAIREVDSLQRPWQRALITERLALLHLAQGNEADGRSSLAEARSCYLAWGALGKVAHLDRNHPFLRAKNSLWSRTTAKRTFNTRQSSTAPSDAVDMLAVLRASQALSSQTSLTNLQLQVQEVLSALTGATSVHVLVRNRDDWILPLPEPAEPGKSGKSGNSGEEEPASSGNRSITVAEAAAQGLLPLSAFRYVERLREPLLLEDATRDERFRRDPYLQNQSGCSLMLVPIFNQDEPTAMLVLATPNSRGVLSAGRLDAVLLIAGQLSVSMNNALLYADLERKVSERTEALRTANEQLEILSVTDPLTGLANRRRLTDYLEAEWQRALRANTPITVAMIDVDHFKLYNDHYGHPAGDACLRDVASAIVRTIRSTDLVARYGGEEFAVVLPDTDLETAHLITERIRQNIEDLGIPHELTPLKTVTVSIGVATSVAERYGSAEHLIKASDQRLYEAKRVGRNRVCC